MSASTPNPTPLRLEGLLALIPDSDGLRGLAEHLLAAARPDPDRRWTGSGELDTAGSRIVDTGALATGIADAVEAEGRRIARAYRRVAEVAVALEEGRIDDAETLFLLEGEALEEEGRAAEAEGWYLSARRLAHRRGSRAGVRALRLAARCARSRGALDDAASRYEEAWREATARSLVSDAVVAATGRGNVEVDRGRWDEAERWYGLALEDAGEGEGALRWPLAQNLAITARESGRFAEAEGWLRKAEEWAGAEEGPHRLDIANGWGQLALARGDAALAVARFREALEGPGPRLSRIGVLVNLGEALLASGRTLEAGEVGREAEAEALAGRVAGRLPEVYRLLARVARARGEPEAFVFLDRALALIRDRRLPPFEEIRTLRDYAELRRKEGEKEAARAALARAEELSRGRDADHEPEQGKERP
jgi:tetratricopeptide (TPR) repeat protein